MVLPPAEARLRLRISAVSGGVKVTAEARPDVVVDRGGAAVATADGAFEIRPERASNSVHVRCPAGADVIIGTRSGGVELEGRFGTVGITSQSGSIRVRGGRRSGSAHGLRRGRGRGVRRAMPGLDDERTHHGGCDRRRGDLHHVGSRRCRRRRRGPSRCDRSAAPSPSARRARGLCMPAPSPARSRSAFRPGCARRCGRRVVGTVRNSFEAGDDIVIDIASVSGTVRLVPA